MAQLHLAIQANVRLMSKQIGFILTCLFAWLWPITICVSQDSDVKNAHTPFDLSTLGQLVRPKSDAIRTAIDVPYTKRDGVELLADIYSPNSPGPHPIMLVIHGGAWVTGDKWQIAIHAEQIVRAGMVVMSINYRLAPSAKYPAQLEDVQDALRYIAREKETLQIDEQKIGIWGYSAGGHLAALAAVTKADNVPRPIVCIAGGAPCDFTVFPDDNRTLALFLGGSKAEKPQVYVDASPVSHVTSDDPPTFFFNGSKDLLVPPDNSDRLYEKLREAGVPSEKYTVEGQGHFATFLNPTAIQKSIEFAAQYLK